MAITFPSSHSVTLAEVHVSEIFDHLVACAPRGKTLGELHSPRSVAIDSVTNKIYVVEGSILPYHARVSIFSEAGEYLNSYTHEDLKALWGIAIHSNNIYMTNWKEHAVFHFKKETEFRLVGRLGGIGPDIGQFNEPRQLSISTNGEVYIADRENNRIQVLDSSLHPIKVIKHPSMHKPCDVKLSTEDMYVLSSEDSPCVHVFTHTGHKIRAIITSGNGMQVTRPLFFCLFIGESLAISDNFAHQVKIFSKDGAQLHMLGKQGNQVGMLSYPYGLALTSNLKLAILSLNSNYGLQIFSFL